VTPSANGTTKRPDPAALSRNELYIVRRGLGDTVDAVGIAAIGLFVPLVLREEMPMTALVVWGVSLAAVALLTSVTTPAIGPGLPRWILRFVWNWGSTVIWAALPWLSPAALEVDHVAWIVVFVVVYGVATDVVFLPQTLEILMYHFVAVYAGSALVALVWVGQWGPAAAVLGSTVAICVGGNTWLSMANRLIEQRDESATRAMTDDLTGLSSREGAVARVEQIRRDAPPDRFVHCLFADLDDFKQLNDTYGYEFGDTALRHVAGHLRSRLPGEWTIARFGGDEFVAIGLDPPVLKGILDLTLPLPTDRGGIEVTHRLSIGMTSRPAADADAAVLFREAGGALRRAKSLGKHRVVEMTDELRVGDDARARLGSRLSGALQRGEIEPWGQPIVDLRTGLPIGVEVLARWPQADGSMVMPSDFVPLIEDQGLGPQLGMVMLAHGIDLLAAFAEEGRSVFVTVNISARHLFHRRLPNEIHDLLRDRGVPPGRLVLEITESQHLPSSPVWKETAGRLRVLGVGLAIDDFGTGYSSMEQLLSMPFTHLKVDRLVTRSIDRPGAHDLAAAMAAMAHGAGMMPIAEGIETESERRAMVAAGYIHGQGFLFAVPRPLEEVRALVCGPAGSVAHPAAHPTADPAGHARDPSGWTR
jgi:diguanylate cyclase (GGDEF)-like protein